MKTASYRKALEESDITAEYDEKKSRFIARIRGVRSEADVKEMLESARKTWPDARHICYAYVLGPEGTSVRSSDDGEPSGTAGKPILNVIQTHELYYTCITVTRIFGGILLGAGGLTRAYSTAAKMAFDAALSEKAIVRACPGKLLSAAVDYSSYEKVKYFLDTEGIGIRVTRYSDKVTVVFAAETPDIERITLRINDITLRTAEIKDHGYTETYKPYS